MNSYIPRNDLVLVWKLKDEGKSLTGIIIPNKNTYTFSEFEVISVGPDVKDLKKGDKVLAEDAFQAIDKLHPDIGLINQKYIHAIIK